MSDPRAWICLLALVSFLAGGAAGFLAGRGEVRPVEPTGRFAHDEARLADALALNDDQRRLFRAVLDHYEAELDEVRDRYEALSASAMEPEVRALGIRYRSLIRDRVLPENKRPLFDALAEEHTRILTEAP